MSVPGLPPEAMWKSMIHAIVDCEGQKSMLHDAMKVKEDSFIVLPMTAESQWKMTTCIKETV